MMRRTLLTLIFNLLLGGSDADEMNKYLFISAPLTKRIVYTKLPDGGGAAPKPMVLVDSGLKMPSGLAVDHKRKQLLVADPELRKVLCYTLVFSGGKVVVQGEPSVSAQDVGVRWVAVDGTGSVFVTDEAKGQILRVPGDKLLRGDPTPKVIYEAGTNSHVSAPGGIAADNFHVYWSNKVAGTEAKVGSIVKGFEVPIGADSQNSVTILARNAPKIYGVCLSENNVFFTDEEKALYGVKKTGSAIATVSTDFVTPRGCAWDGDGSVYVADNTAGQVKVFAGNMRNLAPAAMSVVVNFKDAFGVAVISGAGTWGSSAALLIGFLMASSQW